MQIDLLQSWTEVRWGSKRRMLQDYAEAVKWYRKAADQGFDRGVGALGAKYALGQGVPQDYVEAHKWFNLAASRFPPGQIRDKAAELRDDLAKQMTSEQIAEAQRLAREWRPKKEPPVSEGAGQ